MKKLVLKTALFTVLAVILAVVTAFFALFIFSPKTLGSAFKSLGNDSAAVYFYEKQYKKSGSTSDLAVVVDLLDANTNAEKTYTFSAELVKKDDFVAFCEKNDNGDFEMKTAEFYYAKYALSAFNFKGADTAATVCEDGANLSGYTEYNAFRYLISFAELNDADKQVLSAKITELLFYLPAAEIGNATQDLLALNS